MIHQISDFYYWQRQSRSATLSRL